MADKFLHQKRYAERQKDRRGQIQVKVWVPTDKRDEVMLYAKKLRRGMDV